MSTTSLDMSPLSELVAYGCLVWSMFIVLVQAIGISRMWEAKGAPCQEE